MIHFRTDEAGLRRFALAIADAVGLVEIAKVVCIDAKQRLGIDACIVSFHTTAGRPVVVIDNRDDTGDDVRLAWIIGAWRRDALYTAMLEKRGSVVERELGSYALLVPLVEPTGIAIGSVRCLDHERFPRTIERDLLMACSVVVARLADLGIGAIADELAAKRLTPRQRDVAWLAARGLTNDEIGHALGISPNTVKNRLKEAFVRLDVASRVELVDALRQAPADIDVPFGVSHDGALAITRYPAPLR